MISMKKAVSKMLDKLIDLESSVSTASSAAITVNASGATGSGTVTKVGRIVTLTATINPYVTGIGQLLAGVPGEYYPVSAMWLSCDRYGGSSSEAWIGTDGYIYMSNTVTGDFKVSGTWVASGG